MTEEQRANLTPEERQRLDRAEQVALEMLNRRLREDRRYPRRHMRFVAFVIFGLVGLAFLVALAADLVARLSG